MSTTVVDDRAPHRQPGSGVVPAARISPSSSDERPRDLRSADVYPDGMHEKQHY
jgi:hypothetical protein